MYLKNHIPEMIFSRSGSIYKLTKINVSMLKMYEVFSNFIYLDLLDKVVLLVQVYMS